MNATVQSMLLQHAIQVKLDTLHEVSEQISDLARMYDKVLDNNVAFQIYMQSHGMRYHGLSSLRRNLRSKSQIMWMLSGQLIIEAQRLNQKRMK